LGVTFKAPVPNSISTSLLTIIGIARLVIGSMTFFPIQFLYLLSNGLTATAKSPGIVSGRVLATTIYLLLSSVLLCVCLLFRLSIPCFDKSAFQYLI